MATRINTYDPKDIKLIKSRPMFTNFGLGLFDDYVELHVLSGDNTLESSYNINTWSVNVEDTKNQSPTIQLNIHDDIRKLGYRSGRFDVQYNFFRNIVGNNSDSLIVDEISNSRTEIRVRPKNIDDASINDEFLAFGRREQNPDLIDVEVDFFRDVRLNFGGNEVLVATNWLIDYKSYPESPHSMVIKLYEPLPNDIEEKDELWIVKAVIESIVEPILVEYTAPEAEPYRLAPADFSIPDKYDTPAPTGWKTLDELVSTQDNVRSRILNKIGQRTGSLGTIPLNFDFKIEGSDFSKLVHFGSAVERLENFKYKLIQIEDYSSSVASLSSNLSGLSGTAASGSPFYKSNLTKFTNLQASVISTFDEFEQHLYYENNTHSSSSYGHFWPLTWPKTTTKEPYTLAKVNSTEAKLWYGSLKDGEPHYQTGAIYSASLYDVTNDNSLNRLVPSHITEQENNANFGLYVDMLAQHFDYIYFYAKELLSIHDRSNPLFEGISKDLIQPVLESFGWFPHQGFDFDDLWTYAMGTDSSGSFGGNTINYTSNFTQSVTYANNDQANQSFSKEEITKELWKRILNNLPGIYKSKGAEKSLRSVTSLYGLPSSILKIYEYGGPQKLPNRHSKIIYDRFNFGLRMESSSNGASFLEAPWGPAAADRGPMRYPDTVQFRFKIPDLSHEGKSNNSALKRNTILWHLHSGSVAIVAEHTTSMYSSAPSDSPYGRLVFHLSGSNGQPTVTASTDYGPIFDGDWWNVALMRYDASKITQHYAFTESVDILDHVSQSLTYDMFCKKQGDFSQFGRMSHQLTASLSTDGETAAGVANNSAWGITEQPINSAALILNVPTAQTASTLKQYLGADVKSNTWATTLGSSFSSLTELKALSGSVQEWRTYHNYLTESYFDMHVGAPRTIANGRNTTSSYSDMLLRYSLGCDLGRTDFSNGSIISSSHPDSGRLLIYPFKESRFRFLLPHSSLAAAKMTTDGVFKGFTNTGLTQYEEVEERHYTLSPRNIGPSPYSEKIRLEDNTLRGNLTHDAKKEMSSADTNPVDENRLGVYFSPVDEIELDIAHEFGPFQYDDFVGAPSDEFKKTYNPLTGLRNNYFRKYSGNPTFFDFLYILKYFDDSLFRTIRQLLPARTNAQVGLLVKPHGLERPKVVFKPSASLQGYSVSDKTPIQFTIEGDLKGMVLSASGNTTELGGVFSESYYRAGAINRPHGREGAQSLTPSFNNSQQNKHGFGRPLSNKEKEAALDNRAVGEIEGGVEYGEFYDHRFLGSRYIYTTIDLSDVGNTGTNGARVWNPYWQRDSVGMIIHTPPNPYIQINDKLANLRNAKASIGTKFRTDSQVILGSDVDGGGTLDNYTASNAQGVTQGFEKHGLNRKLTSELIVPFIGDMRTSFEKKKQLYYYATAFSQSLGRPIPEADILSNIVDAYAGSRLNGKLLPSHSLTEPAEYQDYKATSLENLYWNGCKLVGSAFNMESKETIDGGPVVEFYETSPYKYVAADENADGKVLTAGEGTGNRVTTLTRGGSGRTAARPNPRTGRFS